MIRLTPPTNLRSLSRQRQHPTRLNQTLSLLAIAVLSPTALSIAVLSVAVLNLTAFKVATAASPQTPAQNTVSSQDDSQQRAARDEDFERFIRPILAEHCHSCHGPERQEAGLRLDDALGLQTGSDDGPVIDREHLDHSRLLAVLAEDADVAMPPDEPLPADDRKTLRGWVLSGAHWPQDDPPRAELTEQQFASHWAFQPLHRPDLPRVADQPWCRTPIDRFILARLEAENLKPSPATDRQTWLRRASVDLLGIYPTNQQLVKIAQDPRDDELVLSQWVDRMLASPAYGERWARHWLDVARYADTKDYQDSGEVAYPMAWTYRDWVIRVLNTDADYRDFLRWQLAADATDWPADETWRLAGLGFLTLGRRFNHHEHDRIDDRMDVTMRGLLGLTIGCARCHDHKFDPISIEDYYSLYHVFRNSVEPSFADRPTITPPLNPSARFPADEEFVKRLAEAEQELNGYLAEMQTKIDNELRSYVADYLDFIVQQDPRHRTREGVSLVTDRTTLRDRAAYSDGAVIRWRIFLQQVDPDDPVFGDWPTLFDTDRESFPEIYRQRLADGKQTRNSILHQRLTETSIDSLADYALCLGTLLEQAQQRLREQREQDPAAVTLADESWNELCQSLTRESAPLAIPEDRWTELYTLDEYMKYVKLEGNLEHVFVEAGQAAAPRPMSLVDLPTPATTHVMKRGNPAKPGGQVQPGLPEWFTQRWHTPEFVQGSGRHELANEIARSDQPLVARVLANRIWGWHTTQYLVATPNDFGVRSSPPSHPELLDYLATTLQSRNGSLKRLHREIVLSATYRQTSDDRDDGLKVDPQNTAYWRMARRRLEWESLRDCWLAATERLDRRMGGRPVNGLDLQRRTIYQGVVRLNPPNRYQTFDVATSEFSVGKRPETTTVQQSLYLMNQPQMREIADSLAERLTSATTTDTALIDQAFRATLGRPPTADEQAMCAAFLQTTRELAPEIPQPQPNLWSYGYAAWQPDTQTLGDFTALPYGTGKAWQGADDWPSPNLHYLQLTAEGGHAGIDREHAAVRLWRAERDGAVRIQGELRHGLEGEECGDGVEGAIVSSRHALVTQHTVHNRTQPMTVDELSVQAGDTIAFVVSPRDNHSCDVFAWAPRIEYLDATGEVHDAQVDFAKSFSESTPPPQSPVSQLVQTLLISNEFLFVD